MRRQHSAADTVRSRTASDRTDARTLYVRASDPEEPSTLLAGTGVLLPGAAGPVAADEDSSAAELLERLEQEAAAWSAGEAEQYLALVGPDTGEEDRAALLRRAALGAAPLGLVSGAWLQWLTSPANADSETALRILALYAEDLAAGHPRADRGSAYLALLHRLRLGERAVPAARLAHDPVIADTAFQLVGPLLAMSRRPEDFREEILGADLCLRAAGLLPPLALVRELLPTAADWSAVDPGAARGDGAPTGLALSRAAVAAVLAESESESEAQSEVGRRLATGFRWALAALRQWSAALHAELESTLDPAYDMAELLRVRAREAELYHHGFELEGRPLNDWFVEARSEPYGLLRALAASRLVKPGRPDRSPLLRALIAQDGPMFRIFSPTDEAVIRRWVRSLPAAGRPPTISPDAAPDAAPGTAPAVAVAAAAVPPVPDQEPGSLREAYHLLLNRADSPALRRYAVAYVRGWLARSRSDWHLAEHLPPEHWDPRGLLPWLREQHDRHGRDFDSARDTPLPGREALIDSTVQLAPLTLIDGSWLQGFTDYTHASSEVGHLLFSTYWDELGNGEARLNHPLIYREVLREMGVELPPTAAREFAHWPGFREEAFELPVYWLCIGRLPRTFLPEVLGLNVAMELSGVGGGYRQARLALEAHGFSTHFVDIHNTIDNVATGHSAWAAEAVDAYLAAVPELLGPSSRSEVWERVRTGYRSLNPPSGRRARRAARRAQRTARAAGNTP
ncbi:hypothetical protein P3T37_001130 [Kitasatospora sp. MAA4]|uniref:iron-containing redox enzyme family protein n=1 Tax=Kitasatospora sp. MAA4 TaxID=3035093 RepID=UPI0024744CC0|nr:iron-containing redox enzyme family protein [Kitasatospora sp. MAA4]MDH6131756.1 hypothetical protein [Kitasatospora sp. MAA4]